MRREPVDDLAAGLRRHGVRVAPEALEVIAVGTTTGCPVLGWAASGAMSLTGWPDQAPQWPSGDVIGRLTGAALLLGGVAGGLGADLSVDVGALLTERAAVRGSTRRGNFSVGGRCGLVPTSDSWVAVNLARDSDLDLLPALTGGAVTGHATADSSSAVWDELKAFARHRPGTGMVETAQLLGVPAGRLESGPTAPELPWSIQHLGRTAASRSRHPLVVDFSAMWAGPLCAHLLGRCGLDIVKVEDTSRPDAARTGDPGLFDRLHRGHDRLTLDFRSPTDLRRLRSLVGSADLVIEGSRPRALASLGLDPQEFLAGRAGRTWVSITGYGRNGPRSNWVAFGDDAAVAGGLVARSDGGSPVFCADAIADPVTGLCAATGALASFAHGGGHLIDCSMQASSAYAVRDRACAGAHRVERHAGGWAAFHGEQRQLVNGPSSGLDAGGDPVTPASLPIRSSTEAAR